MKTKIYDCDFNEGYFHFTNIKNVNNILEKGLIVNIGTASKMVNDRPNVSVSQGAKGMFGIINSFIFMFSELRKNEIPTEYKEYFCDIDKFDSNELVGIDSACRGIRNKLKNEVYLYIDLDEKLLDTAFIGGLTGFDINIPNNIESSRISAITDRNGKILNAFDVNMYLYQKIKDNDLFRYFNENFFKMMELDDITKKNEETNDNKQKR